MMNARSILFFIVSLTASSVTVAAASNIQEAIVGADYLFCIDGGGSKTSLQIVSAAFEPLEIEHKGETLLTLLSGSTNINFVGISVVEENLRNLLTSIKIGHEKRELSTIAPKAAIIAGIGGLSSNASNVDDLKHLFVSFGFSMPHIVIMPDFLLAKHAIKDEGAILIAGTGSVCYSKSTLGEKRFGGLGYALGDEGSGFYIGNMALKKALREELESKPFLLTQSIRNMLNVSELSNTIKDFYAGELKPADIAGITPLVFSAAFEDNDIQCKKIISKAAKELSKLAKRAIKMRQGSHFTIYLLGGIFKNKHAPSFIDEIKNSLQIYDNVELKNISHENIAVLALLNLS